MHSQLLARGRHDILIVGQVWVPLNVGNIPSASLREESIHSVGRRPALSSSTTYRGGWKGASKSMMNKPLRLHVICRVKAFMHIMQNHIRCEYDIPVVWAYAHLPPCMSE